MNILVTGGLGVNGSRVVRKLVQRGLTPVVLDRREDFSLLPDMKTLIRFVTGDITDLDGMTALLREHRIERVIHMAAYISPDQDREPFPVFTVNTGGTVVMLEASVRARVGRFVYTSSRGLYGEVPPVGAPDYRPIDEDHPPRPAKPYDVSKLASEGMGRTYRTIYGIEFAALRFAGIYGPGKLARHGKMSARSRLVEDPFEGKAVHLPQGGDQLDDIIYVDDVAEGIVLAALAPKLNHTAYNIASGRGQTLRQFCEAVRKALPEAEVSIGPGLNPMGFDVNYYAIYDISRARADLGYEPRFSLEAGVADYVETLKRLKAGGWNA